MSSEKADLLVQPRNFVFTDFKNKNHTLMRVEHPSGRLEGMNHSEFNVRNHICLQIKEDIIKELSYSYLSIYIFDCVALNANVAER